MLIGKSVKREVQFEENSDYQDFYFDIDRSDRRAKLFERLDQASLLVARKRRVHDIDVEIVKRFPDYADIGIWRVYY